MNIEEAKLYLEHTSKDDFNLEEWEKENRYKAIQVILQEIERLNNIINEFNKLIENEINESKLEEDYERVDAMEYCLATLRELKGSDKK